MHNVVTTECEENWMQEAKQSLKYLSALTKKKCSFSRISEKQSWITMMWFHCMSGELPFHLFPCSLENTRSVVSHLEILHLMGRRGTQLISCSLYSAVLLHPRPRCYTATDNSHPGPGHTGEKHETTRVRFPPTLGRRGGEKERRLSTIIIMLSDLLELVLTSSSSHNNLPDILGLDWTLNS